ncbi:hypothetical protein ABN584_11010 [Gloeocapsa sp. BRSZ]|uniref:hypothetical protein n=1 Tax=Gloeocapsa sp. PCC 7428 TaxID=1173026 RepID=UPI0002A60D61|nr:hypothetical protein [Gloeocapsa sp. PCC 7428]AFZ31699.1 hypothetical protein Glo7428_3213 [Gloeocapsa sp. PCC 7428]
MEGKILWQQGNSKPDNLDNFAVIQQWWSSLANKQVTLAQRMIPQTGDVDQLDWEPQRFDEVFEIKNPEIRGITLYWQKPDTSQTRNTTPHQLVLDTHLQQLYIFPQSQKQLVIRVALREVNYETIEVKNPHWLYRRVGENHILTLRDNHQQLEVKITLNPDSLSQLKEQLP